MMRSLLRSAFIVLPMIGGTLAGTARTPAMAQDATPAPAKPKAGAKATAAKPAEAGADAQGARDPAKAQRSYETGVAAYQAGRYDEALNSLNAAVQAGGLSGSTLAKALYYRGATFQAKGMPGQAISDLTSALWFKGGLADQERADATRIRGEAYRAAGLNEQGGATGSASVAATAPQTIASGPTEPAPATPQLNALPTEQAAPSSGGLEIGNLFSGLFGGSGGGSKPVETAAIPPSAAASAERPNGGAEVLPWGAVATPAAAIVPEATAKAAPAPAAKREAPKAGSAKAATAKPEVAVAAAATGGTVRIQVGTVKSAEEANALAARLKGNAALSGAEVSIDQAAFGGTTYYRVKVGPYANAAATKAPCLALKQGGLDCLVTAQ